MLSSGRQLFKWGLDAKQLEADYDYASTPAVSTDALAPVAVTASPQGLDLALYASDRVHVSDKLSLELGLRWELHTYADVEGMVSPRVNAAYAAGPKTTLRLGWGHFYQPQGIHELQVEDGVDRFSGAELAEHRLLSLEHEFGRGVLLQANAYQKQMSNLRPRFENLFDPFGFFPEGDVDRVKIAPAAARAEGLELMLRRPLAQRLAWWAGYTLSRAEDEVEGVWVARNWDQRHALSTGVQWRAGRGWDFTVAGLYHSGTPTTPVSAEMRTLEDGSTEIVPLLGPRNSQRLPAYQRFDVRIGRIVPLGHAELRAYLTVTNLFDRQNSCCVSDFDYAPSPDGTVEVQPVFRHGLPRLASLALSLRF
jgi:outer membrane receptor protein involved in Fe transport